MLEVFTLVNGPWRENCHIASSGRDAVIIDPGGDFAGLEQLVEAQALHVHAVVNTHAHYDHLGAVAPSVAKWRTPFHLHRGDDGLLARANFYRVLFLGEEAIEIPIVDVWLNDGDRLAFGDVILDVIHTPGHTPGSVCFDAGDQLFTGDTLMATDLGRTDLPGGDEAVLLDSVRSLLERFGDETRLYAGHGPSSTLGEAVTAIPALSEPMR